MKTDRELLEAAAKAAGVDLEWDGPPEMWAPMYYYGKTYRQWNPLADDGDVFRLAVKLRISLNMPGQGTVQAQANDESIITEVIYKESDPATVIRRAIVRAAAAMVAG